MEKSVGTLSIEANRYVIATVTCGVAHGRTERLSLDRTIMGNGFYEGSVWNEVPDSILLKIFSFLESSELVSVSSLSRQWLRVSRDKLLWRNRLVIDFKLNTRQHSNVQVDLSTLDSGLEDYQRLIYETPKIKCQTLREHKDEASQLERHVKI